MPLETDAPDTMEALWAKAEAKADAFEASAPKVAPVAAPAPAKDEPDDEAEAEPAAKADKPKDDPAEPADPDRAQLEELAKKHGFVVDGNKVTVQERVKWREDVRKDRERAAKRDQEFTAKVSEVEANLHQRFGRASKALEAWEKGDFDGVAKALEGDDKIGWRDLQGRAAQRIMSPEAKRIRELEERETARERADRERQEQQAQAEEQQKLTHARAEFQQKLTTNMGSSENRVVKALSAAPQFVGAVMSVIEREWRENGRSLSAEEALHEDFGGAKLIDNAKTLWHSLSAAFGDPDPSNQETPSGAGNRGAEDSARPGKKPKTLSRNGAAEVSARGKYKDDSDFIAQWSKRIAEADG
jgi:hypothetical protein